MHVGAVDGRGGGQPMTGGARVALGRQPAVRRQVLKRSCQPGRGECPAGAHARPAERDCPSLRMLAPRYLAWSHAPDGARRARRALEDVKKVLTDRTMSVVDVLRRQVSSGQVAITGRWPQSGVR
jgi:hypothetical protein